MIVSARPISIWPKRLLAMFVLTPREQRLVVEQLCHGSVELLAGSPRLVRVEDLRHLLHLSGEGCVRDHLPVGKRSPFDHARTSGGGELSELACQPRLADARGPEQRDELRPRLSEDVVPDPLQRGELRNSSQHRDATGGTLSRAGRSCNGAPNTHRLLLAFGDNRLGVLVANDRTGCSICLLTHEDPVHRRSFLQTRGRVDDVAGNDALPLRSARTERHDQ